MTDPFVNLETISPEIAHQYLGRNTHNRPVSAAKVKEYAAQMKEGLWKLTNDAISFSDTGVLLGGQHRLRAVIQADVTLPFFVARGLDISAQDVMDAGLRRNAGHALAIAGFSYSKTRPAAAAMLRFIKKGVVPRLSVAEILQDVYSQRDLFDLALPAVGPVNELGLARPAIVFAVGMAFFEANAEKASDFFSRLASGSNLPIDHPILTLRNRLMGEKAGRTKKERHGYLTIGLWLNAWNAFVEGRTLTTRGLKHTQVDSNNKYVVPPIRKGEKHD